MTPYYTKEKIASLIERFEAQKLPKSEWTHEAHLAVAVWYCMNYSPEQVLDRVRRNITLHNESVGTPNSDTEGYHETITRFWLYAVRQFLKKHRGLPLEKACNELIGSEDGRSDRPLEYFSKSLLFSTEARRNWVEPNLKSLADAHPRSLLSVRELQEIDIGHIADYWLNADPLFLVSIGVDLNKLPAREDLTQMLLGQLQLPIEQRRSYCIIWEVNGQPVGHSNTNPTHYGEYAYMHLHLWDPGIRGKGFGMELVKMTLPCFFNNLRLKKLFSEPYALNPGPNHTLEKVGFQLVREYTTVPGSLNFEQPVKRWELTRERFGEITKNA